MLLASPAGPAARAQTPAQAPSADASASVRIDPALPLATPEASADAHVQATLATTTTLTPVASADPHPLPTSEPLLEIVTGSSHSAIPVATASLATDSVPATASVATPDLLVPEVVIPRPRTVTILHTNDWYGLFDPVKLDPYSSRPRIVGGLGRAAAVIKQERAKGSPLLLLCAGNVLGPNSVSAASKGLSMVEAMNRMGYDAWMPSNHDFSYGLDSLVKCIKASSASVVLTNIRWAKTDQTIARPYAVFERGGMRIAVLGVVDANVDYYIDFSDRNRLMIDPPLDAIARWVPIIRQEAHPDMIVCLTHLSLDQEMPLLTRDSGVDLVVGGFNSSNPNAIAVHDVKGIDGKHALHAGGFGTAIGKARLTFEPDPQGAYRLSRIEPDLMRLDDDAMTLKQAESEAKPIVSLTQQTKRAAATAWTEEHGDLARLKEGLSSDEAMGLVPEIMRLSARAEVGIVPRSFFQNERVFGPITSAKNLYYAMPWEDALCVEQLSGDKLLAAYNQATGGTRPAAFLAGLYTKGGTVMVNGRPLDPKAYYSVATTLPAAQGQIPVVDGLKGKNVRPLTVSVRRSVVKYFRAASKEGRVVGPDGFPDYTSMPFWKSTMQIQTDLQRRNVDSAGNRYPDLTWKGDKSGMSWGGDMAYQLGTSWGPNDLVNTLNLSYHSDSLSDGKTQVSSDKIQYIGDVRGMGLSALMRPYGTLTLTTRFVNDPGPVFFLGQLGTGMSHQFPVGVELREGFEYRRQLFDPTQPDKLGGTFELLLKQSLMFLSVSTDLKLFATPKIAQDGVLIDDESVFSVPLTDITALSYKVNLYRNTLYPDWATRHLVGLTFKFNQPWLF